MTRVALSWSSGKLYRLKREPGVEVAALVTTVNAELARVATHAVCRSPSKPARPSRATVSSSPM